MSTGSKGKHTPGPWNVFTETVSSADEVAEHFAATARRGLPVIWGVLVGRTQEEARAAAEKVEPGADAGNVFVMMANGPDSEANARLVAAAPEMLAALKAQRCFQCLDTEPDEIVCDNCRTRRAAIAKATGGAS